MYLYLIWTIKYSDKFTEIKYNTWKSSAVGHTTQEYCLYGIYLFREDWVQLILMIGHSTASYYLLLKYSLIIIAWIFLRL